MAGARYRQHLLAAHLQGLLQGKRSRQELGAARPLLQGLAADRQQIGQRALALGVDLEGA
jgi:hypothetical protein